MQPRRRAATYGKSSRKAFSDLPLSATDTFGQDSQLDELAKSARPSPLCNQLTKSKALETKNQLNLPEPEYSGTSLGRTLYSPVEVIGSTQAKLSSKTCRYDALYDVPSDDSLEHKQGERMNSRKKRRKITPKLEPERSLSTVERVPPLSVYHEAQPDFVAPQDPAEPKAIVQRGITGNHSSINVPGQNGRSLKTQDSLIPQLGSSLDQIIPTNNEGLKVAKSPDNKTSKSTKIRKIPAKSQPLSHVVVDRTLPSRGLKKSSRVSSMPKNRHDARHNATNRASSVTPKRPDMDSEDNPSSSRAIAQPVTPPKQSRPTSNATTPHQRAVWSLLLPADTNSESPRVLDIPKLRLSDIEPPSPAKARTNPSLLGCKNDTDASEVPRRRRIVDTLQRQVPEPDYGVFVYHSEPESDADHPQRDDDSDSREISPGQITSISGHSSDNEGRHTTSSSITQRRCGTSHPAPVLPGSSLKMTYSRQRSYLTESDCCEAIDFDKTEPRPLIAKRSTKRMGLQDTLPSLQSGRNNTEEFEILGNSQAAPLRSIHELREAGGNVRLLSEIEALLDDIEDYSSSISLRRIRLLELAKRLQDAPVRQIFAENGFGPRLLNALCRDSDPILNTLFAAAILLLVSGSQSTQVIGQLCNPSMVELLVKLLEMDESITSIAKARGLNVSKIAQFELEEYWGHLRRSSTWRAGCPEIITPCVLALQCLEYLIRQAREVGKGDRILQQHAIEKIIGLLKAPESGCPSPPYDTPTTQLRLAISILESYTIARKVHEGQDFCDKATLEPIVSLLASMDNRFSHVPETLRALTLRLYINLTNNSPEACSTLSRPDVLKSIFNMVISHFEHASYNPSSDNLSLDSLILALGSLINLAEWNGNVPRLMMELQHEGSALLEHLVRLFQLNVCKTAEVRKTLWGI